MPPRALSTSRISRIAAVLLLGRLAFVWAAPSVKPVNMSVSPSTAPASGMPLIKKDPLLEAIKLADNGKVDESEQALKTILKAGPNAGAHNALGVLYFRQKKTDEALKEFGSAVVLDPKSADAYFNRATARTLKGDISGALGDFTKVVDLNPSAPGQLSFAHQEIKRLMDAAPVKKP